MKQRKPKDIGHIFADGALIDEAIREAGREARRRHKLAGRPIVVGRNGRAVRITPEDILVAPRKSEA